MKFQEAVHFCDQNHSNTLYALDISEEGKLSVYSVYKIPFEPEGENIVFFCTEQEIFGTTGYVSGYNLMQAAELTKELVFFSEKEIRCNDIFILELLMARFPSLKQHKKSKKVFADHAIECIRSFNQGVELVA
jgi:hypothetical protein